MHKPVGEGPRNKWFALSLLPQAELAAGSKRRVMAFSLLLFFLERSEIAPRKKGDTNHTAEIKTVQCPGGSGEIDLSRV